ncbi:hypothetical protein ARHIZOSPH14_15240 [Agromyces rhizosphaerae]|uniref:ER-bound oxygenase mpaB/mpaB'/Rubber oxygenase catalytic domain-containing protein n=1 Tax=Agromyces rhizosphaerae TaxID=88374 RepID=A0A9W6CVJ7_9MICO|nr:oxygenase MpaB family protein [Agromyces rhizosphaerae]GLI27282.1 hypothetical protein ARHIZOSPH14_15240 [Agromyces rhizosphaerae]
MTIEDTNAPTRRAEREWLDALPTPTLQKAATPFIAVGSAANIIMQLSWPAVGYGVKDSKVESALFRDPERRRRTTVGLLAVAVFGNAEERAAFRRATNRSHAQVRSPEGAEPAYNAFDPELQRWVAACLYIGFEDAYEAVWGGLDDATRAAMYAESVVLGGMLQMPAEMWPDDRAAFQNYWEDGLERAHIDDSVRAYLTSVMRLEYLPKPPRRAIVRLRELITAGSLPPQLREQMHLPWTEKHARKFRRFSRTVAWVIRRMPERRRAALFTNVLDDVRLRMAEGRPLFE